MPTEHKTTYCRICESLCGMVAEVEGGRLVSLRADKDHPLSAGFACQKGIAFTEVVNDPDRVTAPLRRRADGTSPRGSGSFTGGTARGRSAGTSATRESSATPT